MSLPKRVFAGTLLAMLLFSCMAFADNHAELKYALHCLLETNHRAESAANQDTDL